MDISDYHHNPLYDFIRILPALFAWRAGEAQFSDFAYKQQIKSGRSYTSTYEKAYP